MQGEKKETHSSDAQKICNAILSYIEKNQHDCIEEDRIWNAMTHALEKHSSLFSEQVSWEILNPSFFQGLSGTTKLQFIGSLRTSILVGFLWGALHDKKFSQSITTLLRIAEQCSEQFWREMSIESIPVDALHSVVFELNALLKGAHHAPAIPENALASQKKLIQHFLAFLSDNPTYALAFWHAAYGGPRKKNAVLALKSTWEKDPEMIALIEGIEEQLKLPPARIECPSPVLKSNIDQPEWKIGHTREIVGSHITTPPPVVYDFCAAHLLAPTAPDREETRFDCIRRFNKESLEPEPLWRGRMSGMNSSSRLLSDRSQTEIGTPSLNPSLALPACAPFAKAIPQAEHSSDPTPALVATAPNSPSLTKKYDFFAKFFLLAFVILGCFCIGFLLSVPAYATALCVILGIILGTIGIKAWIHFKKPSAQTPPQDLDSKQPITADPQPNLSKTTSVLFSTSPSITQQKENPQPLVQVTP